MISSKLAEKLVPPARFEHAAYGLGNRPLVVGNEGKRQICAVMCPVCSGLSREHTGIKVHDAPGGKGCAGDASRPIKRRTTYADRSALRQAEYAERANAALKARADELDDAPEAAGLCYFVGCAEGIVKIGFSRSMPQRLAQLRAASLFKLTLLATVRGGRAREMGYHARFAAHALGGEWFTLVPEIQEEIDAINHRGGAEA